jgi:hypothetical protein
MKCTHIIDNPFFIVSIFDKEMGISFVLVVLTILAIVVAVSSAIFYYLLNFIYRKSQAKFIEEKGVRIVIALFFGALAGLIWIYRE